MKKSELRNIIKQSIKELVAKEAASFPVKFVCRPKSGQECGVACEDGKKCTKVSDCGPSGCCKCVKLKVKKN